LKNRDHHLYYVSCAHGLEPVLHEELLALNMGRVERQVGGCVVEGMHEPAERPQFLQTADDVAYERDSYEAQESPIRVGGAIGDDRGAEHGGNDRADADQQRKVAVVQHLLSIPAVRVYPWHNHVSHRP